MNVIKKPAEGTRSVLISSDEGTVFLRGRKPILEDMEPGQASNIVFRCRGCGAYNETLE